MLYKSTHLLWLLPLRSRPWKQQWHKPPGAVVLVAPEQAVQVPMPVLGRQRPRTVKWVPPVQLRCQLGGLHTGFGKSVHRHDNEH